MKKQYSILCIGNSHTAGFPLYDPMMGGNPESSYQHWLKKGLTAANPSTAFDLSNQGICGDTAQGISARLQKALRGAVFNLVIISGGTNDLGMVPDSNIVSNLEQGYNACRKSQVPLIIATIPPVSLEHYIPHVKAVNSGIQSYAMDCCDVSLVDWFSALKNKKDFLKDCFNAGDGVHLSVEGYKCIGELLVPAVIRALNIS